MKKTFSLFIILPILCAISLSALASSYVPFTNIAQAIVYCPSPVAGLTFKAANHTKNSAGTISGTKNNVIFHSASVQQPKSGIGIVENVSFRPVNGILGYISGNQITCLYSYPGIYTNVALILGGTQ